MMRQDGYVFNIMNFCKALLYIVAVHFSIFDINSSDKSEEFFCINFTQVGGK
jgi:hypothetical protein